MWAVAVALYACVMAVIIGASCIASILMQSLFCKFTRKRRGRSLTKSLLDVSPGLSGMTPNKLDSLRGTEAIMNSAKRAALEAAGWRFGDAADFLEMTNEERQLLDARVALALA